MLVPYFRVPIRIWVYGLELIAKDFPRHVGGSAMVEGHQ